jgi:hypothetical protein
MEAIDAFSVYTDAARKALDRRQAAEESYREQSHPAASRFEAEFPTLAAVLDALPQQTPEEKAAQFKDAFETMERIDREIRREALVDLFANQENNIREEWLADLQTGRLDRHALDSYFAGRVDQHNTLIGMAVEAHPDLRETLPPPIQYGEVRDQLRQLAQRQTERNSHAVEEQFRFAV